MYKMQDEDDMLFRTAARVLELRWQFRRVGQQSKATFAGLFDDGKASAVDVRSPRGRQRLHEMAQSN